MKLPEFIFWSNLITSLLLSLRSSSFLASKSCLTKSGPRNWLWDCVILSNDIKKYDIINGFILSFTPSKLCLLILSAKILRNSLVKKLWFGSTCLHYFCIFFYEMSSFDKVKKLTHHFFLVENRFKSSTQSPGGKSIKKLTHHFFLIENRFKSSTKSPGGKSIKKLTHHESYRMGFCKSSLFGFRKSSLFH